MAHTSLLSLQTFNLAVWVTQSAESGWDLRAYDHEGARQPDKYHTNCSIGIVSISAEVIIEAHLIGLYQEYLSVCPSP